MSIPSKCCTRSPILPIALIQTSRELRSLGILFEHLPLQNWKSILHTTRLPLKLSSLVSDSALLLRSQSLKTCDTFTCVLSQNLDPQIPDSDGYKVGQWVRESAFLRQSNMVLGHTLLGALTGGFSRSALQRGVFGGWSKFQTQNPERFHAHVNHPQYPWTPGFHVTVRIPDNLSMDQ